MNLGLAKVCKYLFKKFGHRFRHPVLKWNASTYTLSNLVPTADSFTSVLDRVAQDLNVDDALNQADQVVMGTHALRTLACARY